MLLLLTAAPARARESWSRLDVPAQVVAGQILRLRLPQPPAGVEEFEVLLSLDDGRTFPLRVTPELEARGREWAWSVPAFATGSARLKLRFRRDELEQDGEVSEAFVIVATGPPDDPRVFHECGWWEGLDAGTGPLPSGWTRGEPAPDLRIPSRIPAPPPPSPTSSPTRDGRGRLLTFHTTRPMSAPRIVSHSVERSACLRI